MDKSNRIVLLLVLFRKSLHLIKARVTLNSDQFHSAMILFGFQFSFFRRKRIISKGIFLRVYKEGGCFCSFIKTFFLILTTSGGRNVTLKWNVKSRFLCFKNHCHLNLRVEIEKSLLTWSTNCCSSLRLLAADTPATAAKSNRIAQWLFIIKLQTETKWIARHTFSLYRQSVINFIIYDIKSILMNGY